MRALVLAALLLVPAALAHVQHERPSIQEAQAERQVIPRIEGANATFEYLDRRDPASDYVRHVVDPRRGVFLAEHRPQMPAADEAFGARFVVTRIIEYRDQNQDGRYSPPGDTVVRQWLPQGYVWNTSSPQRVSVGGVQGQLVRWTGNITAGPQIVLDVVASGSAFADEGANVRQQDVAIYLRLRDLPPRGTGNLHAIEGEVVPLAPATVSLVEAENVTVALLVEAPRRLAILDWGGQALVDGAEQAIPATVENRSGGGAIFRLHLPRADRDVSFVMVSGIEYTKPSPRESGGGLALLALAAVALAALRRAR